MKAERNAVFMLLQHKIHHHRSLVHYAPAVTTRNLILCRLAKCCDASISALAAKFHIEPHDVVRSNVTDSLWFYFSKLVWSVSCLLVSFLCVLSCILLFMLHSCALN